MSLQYFFYGGKIVPNYVVKGTAAGAGKGNFSTAETEHRITVPTGKKWLLWDVTVYRDVNATLVVYINNSSDETIIYLGASGAGTGFTSLRQVAYPSFPTIMKAGDYVRVVFGANQAAIASIAAVVTEVPV